MLRRSPTLLDAMSLVPGRFEPVVRAMIAAVGHNGSVEHQSSDVVRVDLNCERNPGV